MAMKKIRLDLKKFLMFIGTLCLLGHFSLLAKNQTQAEKTTPDKRLEGYETYVRMQKSSIFNQLAWRFIGPDTISGRCTDVDVPKGSKHTIYVATATGGVWKTTNSGISWEPIMENVASPSIGDIAVDPSDASIIWAGTGECNIYRASVAGTGIYKSTDAGKTWQHMGLSDTNTIARIVVHPGNSDTVYVAASGHEWTPNSQRGVFKTINGGKTWKKILYIDDTTGAIDLVMAPDDPDTLYVSMWNRTRKRWSDPVPEPGDGIFKSVDGGKTWQHKTEGLPDPATTRRIGLDIAQSNPKILYTLIDNHQPGRPPDPGETDAYGHLKTEPNIKGAEVYRSDDKGETWTKVSPSDRFMENICGTYGWVFGQIRVDPKDENTVYIMGIWMARSKDGGRTWKNVGNFEIHGDHHGLWVDPEDPDYLINANDGGVSISYDGGAKWRNFFRNFPVAQFYNVALDWEKPFHIYGSAQDHGTYRGSVTHQPNKDYMTLGSKATIPWERLPGGEATAIAIDPINPQTVYSSGPFYGRLMRSELKENWESKSILPQVMEGEHPLRGQWLAPTIISPHNPRVLYHGMQYVFRSMDRGEGWERISPDLTYNDPKTMGKVPYMIPFHCITQISESPLKFGLIYAGTDDGRIHVTRGGGDEWTEITGGLPPGKHVSGIVASRYDESTVYLTMHGRSDDDMRDYIFRSGDYGKTWLDISGNIPCGPVNVIREDPKKKQILYVGTDFGAYVTLDGGKKWHILGDTSAARLVWDLQIQPRDNVLVAATYGRGIWAIDDLKPVQEYNLQTEDEKKPGEINLHDEIAGVYQVDLGNEIMPLSFYFEEGKLYALMEDSAEKIGFDPIKGRPLCYKGIFTGLPVDVEFIQESSGRIKRCILGLIGSKFEGKKK